MKFLHALEIHQDYLAHTPIGTGVSPQNFNRENLKFGSKIQRIHVNKFGTNGDTITFTNFYSYDVPRARGYNLGTMFGRPAPLNLGGPKNCPNFFSGDCISALKGGCALKFLHALEIHEDYLAHTPIGTGVSPRNFNREI